VSAPPSVPTQNSTRPVKSRSSDPLLKQMFLVVDVLKTSRQAYNAEQLFSLTRQKADIAGNPELHALLLKNPRVHFSDTAAVYSYSPMFKLSGPEELVELVRNKTEGFQRADLEDAYVNAKADVAKLIESGTVYSIRNVEAGRGDVIFWNRRPDIKPASENVLQLWQSVRLPESMTEADLEAALKKLGKEPIQQTDEPPSVSAKEKKRKAKKQRRIKLTNVHLTGAQFLKGD